MDATDLADLADVTDLADLADVADLADLGGVGRDPPCLRIDSARLVASLFWREGGVCGLGGENARRGTRSSAREELVASARGVKSAW